MEVKVTAWGGAVCVCSEHYTVKAIRILFLLVCPSITSVQPSSAGWSKRAARGMTLILVALEEQMLGVCHLEEE